jgi:hypothetical protein
LVNQAAYSFNNWFGVKPNTDKALIDLKSLWPNSFSLFQAQFAQAARP